MYLKKCKKKCVVYIQKLGLAPFWASIDLIFHWCL